MKETKRILLICLIALLVSANPLCAQDTKKSKSSNKLKREVEKVINLRDGIQGWYSSETRKLIKKVKKNPEKYRPYVNSKTKKIISIIRKDLMKLQNHMILRKFNTCISLHVSFASETDKQMIRFYYKKIENVIEIIKEKINEMDETDESNEDLERLNSLLDKASSLRSYIMNAMAEINDPYLLSQASKYKEKKKWSKKYQQALLFTYLLELSKRNDKAKKLLKKMYNDKSSPLYKNKTAKRVIDERDKK